MIRTKGEAGTGDVVHAVQHMRQITREIKALTVLAKKSSTTPPRNTARPTSSSAWSPRTGKLPVPNFSAGGIATPADAALMMQLGAETVFVGSGIFMKERATPLDVEHNPKEREEAVSRAKAIVIATTHYNDPKIVGRSQRSRHRHHEGPRRRSHRRAIDLLQTRGW
jgi:pyridoxal 5'-phosphate synthase pdxS subunit